MAEPDPLGARVDTDDFNGGNDGLHYTGEGYARMGERVTEEALKLVYCRAS